MSLYAGTTAASAEVVTVVTVVVTETGPASALAVAVKKSSSYTSRLRSRVAGVVIVAEVVIVKSLPVEMLFVGYLTSQ